jgi:hypothetical protein
MNILRDLLNSPTRVNNEIRITAIINLSPKIKLRRIIIIAGKKRIILSAKSMAGILNKMDIPNRCIKSKFLLPIICINLIMLVNS